MSDKKIEVWYFEPDELDKEHQKFFFKKNKIDKKINFKHFKMHISKGLKLEGTPDIIFIDTASIDPLPGLGFIGSQITLQGLLCSFIKQHRSSLIVICSYVFSFATSEIDTIKRILNEDDLYLDSCENGIRHIAEYISNRIKNFIK